MPLRTVLLWTCVLAGTSYELNPLVSGAPCELNPSMAEASCELIPLVPGVFPGAICEVIHWFPVCSRALLAN